MSVICPSTTLRLCTASIRSFVIQTSAIRTAMISVGVVVCVFSGVFLNESKLFAQDAAGGEGPRKIRVAVFNIQELSSQKLASVDDSGAGANEQLKNTARILQKVAPDILLINEIDYDGPANPTAADMTGDNPAIRFRNRYLSVFQDGQPPLDFPYVYYAPSNTGEPTGMDLDNDGTTDGPRDAYGYGTYPGEYAMALYSRFPIDVAAARTFRLLKWSAMPGNLMPDGQAGRPDFYSKEEQAVFRLSSKSHWDVPVTVPGAKSPLHLLCSHPTPPVFDGTEDANGRRNFDEIRLTADYITGGDAAKYIQDDTGKAGGLAADATFVILGDQNSDPVRGDHPYGKPAIRLLLDHPRVLDPQPKSDGALESNNPQNLPNYLPFKTSQFGRLDYALPSRNLKTVGAGVYWPTKASPEGAWVAKPDSSSDHRCVWVDIELP